MVQRGHRHVLRMPDVRAIKAGRASLPESHAAGAFPAVSTTSAAGQVAEVSDRNDERLIDTQQVIVTLPILGFDLFPNPQAFQRVHRVFEVPLAKQPLVIDGKEKRLAEFEKHFGRIDALETEFVNYMESAPRRASSRRQLPLHLPDGLVDLPVCSAWRSVRPTSSND